MTSTKLPPDSELATPIGGKQVDPELEAKLTDDKQRHKRDRFKALKMPRVNALVQKHKQLINLANRSNYKFTEGEAELIVQLYKKLLEDAEEKWLNHDSFNLVKLETFDQTELD